jgi:hypothetical protein
MKTTPTCANMFAVSGPTEVARISNVERRMPSRSSYSLV